MEPIINTKRSKKNIKLFFLILQIFIFHSVAQENLTRQLNNDWEFYKGDLGGVWEAYRSEKQSRLPEWEKISVPHCYNAFDAVDPDIPYYQGPAWYRTTLQISNPYENGRTLLHFQGAGQKTKVYVNQILVGEHVGGYDEFQVDITESVKKYFDVKKNTENIPIAIRCDNSRDVEMIPSDLSDFSIYGGLYRPVTLVYLPAISIKNIKVDYVLDDGFNNAHIEISSEIYNPTAIKSKLDYTIEILNPKNIRIHKKQFSSNVWSGKKILEELSLNMPQLWSPESPNLYTVQITVLTGGDSYSERLKTGFREAVFTKKGPLILNGDRLLLRGTHRHEDHAGVGAAMGDSLLVQEIQLMKLMGVNFIRLGHYQQSRRVLELCDELGILVWEEIPWCRGGLGGEKYQEQARRMLTNMINQHYNHPAVIIWGLGNENDWPGDFEEFAKEKIRQFMSELNDLSHSLDPNRKTAIRRCEFCMDIVDVYSPSIWAGWYRGKYINYKEVSYKEAMKVDHFLHVEWGASNHTGRHSENPDIALDQIRGLAADERDGDFLMTGGNARVSKDGDWSETYACNLIDWHLKEQETMHWLTGTAYWPFKDFSTPLRPENPIPYVNQKGVVQRDLRKKEAYYVFQSYWTATPMIRIYGHSWETRWGQLDKKNLIKIYSNCSEAELFLNGVSLGKRNRNSQDFPAAGLRWTSQFNKGVNKLKAIGYKDGKTVVDEVEFKYQTEMWTDPHNLELKELSRDKNIILTEVKVFDKEGNFCLDAKNLVEFSVAGDAEMIDNLGTWDGSRKIQLYNGRAMIKVKITGSKAVLGVTSVGLVSNFIDLIEK